MQQKTKKIIPLARPFIGKEEIDSVNEVLKSGILSIGPKAEEFERDFSKAVGCKYAVAVSSGTAALHLCMRAIGIKKNDEVITSPFSFVASANCVLYENGTPIFSDIDSKTYNIDPAEIKKAITQKTKALLPVHIFGHPCDMDPIMEIAEKNNLPVVEDACESLYAKYKGKNAGTFGLASTFAFYPNKQITTGEGGMICTNDKEVYDLCRSLRNQGRGEKDEWLQHDKIGYNYRLDEMSCALGIVQLKKIDYIVKKRADIAEKYGKELDDSDDVVLPYTTPNAKHSWFVYVIRLKGSINRDKVMKMLNQNGIATKPYLPSIHLQPIYRKLFKYNEGSFPVSEKASKSTLALPFYIGISDEDIGIVCDELKKAIKLSK